MIWLGFLLVFNLGVGVGFALAALFSSGGHPEDHAPTASGESLAEWEEPRVQTVYRLICGSGEPPNPEEHWEGYLARQIVAALFPQPPVQQTENPDPGMNQ